MKVKVLEQFIDKYTGELHSEGDVMEVTRERMKEIQSVSKNLIETVKEERKKVEE